MSGKSRSLFSDAPSPTAAARKSDSITSVIAAEQVESSGTAACHRERIADYVGKCPGHTGTEVAAAIGLTQHQVMRRVHELIKRDRVSYGDRRICQVKGSSMKTIWPQPPFHQTQN